MRTLILLSALLFGANLWSQNFQDSFEEGNELYRAEEYNEAIDAYRQILEAGYENAALYYNFGNAYFKTNQVGRAILNYERAARLAPHDDEIQQNLEIARQATIDEFAEIPKPIMRAAYLSVLRAFQPDTWAIIALSGFGILLIGAFIYFFTSIQRRGFVVASVGIVVGVLSLFLAYGHQNYLEENTPAIVMATSSYVKSGPGERAEDVFILHEGTKVVIIEDYEEWKKVKLPDGKVGWIQSEDVETI